MSRNHACLDPRQWAAVRRAVFERDGYRCRACGLPGRLECDHIQPLRRGGDPWDMDNLQSLCRGCHIAKTAAENERERTPENAAWCALRDELRG